MTPSDGSEKTVGNPQQQQQPPECVALMVIKRPEPKRPCKIRVNAPGGGAMATVDIASHDKWYIAMKKDFRRQLFKKHIDRAKLKNRRTSDATFIQLIKKYQLWERGQRWWYEHWGMTPPIKVVNEYGDSATITRTRVYKTGYRPAARTSD